MRIYLDTMVWIYFLEGDPAFEAEATALMSRVRQSNHTVLTSFLVEGELLVLPKRKAAHFTEAAYKRIFASPQIASVPYPPPSPDLYAELRARYRTKPVDTLHATLAAAAGADLLVTEDKRLLAATVPGIGRIATISQAMEVL